MKYKIVPVTSFEQNSTVLWCEKTRRGAVTDPGGDIDRILACIDEQGVELEKIILTHGHIDHVGYTLELVEKTGVPVIGPHKDDEFLLDTLDEYAAMTGLTHSGKFKPVQWLDDGDEVRVGDILLQVVHCPGHTPGHIVLVQPDDRLAIVGDVLFRRSIGRTDFPRGNHAHLIDSITRKLLPLGDDITFIPGHGPISTFGEERAENPFIQ